MEAVMDKLFEELKEGERFSLPGKVDPFSGKPYVFEKIPFMQNFYRTTGNKRNARYIISTSKMNNRYLYVEDDQKVQAL
jgi:hypothetical protein